MTTTITRFSKNASFSNSICSLGWKLHSHPCFIYVNNFRRMVWSIRSNVDANEFDPSSGNGGRTQLIRSIQSIQTKLGVGIHELRKNLPMKILFFLVGFYCATAFATVIGQTCDWDILSAVLAVFVVEGVGALMYRAYLPLLNNVRSLISIFNYWKVGLPIGPFLDSFKYELIRLLLDLTIPLVLNWICLLYSCSMLLFLYAFFIRNVLKKVR